jgi:hypothetical protein
MPTKLSFLTDDHHFAIANVAVRSGQMETHLEYFVGALLRWHQNTAEFLLKNLGNDRIVELLRALLRDEPLIDKDEAERIVSEIKRLRKERNEVLHWIWGKSLDEDVAVHLSYRPFRDQQLKTKTASEVQKIADDMLEVGKVLIRWQEQIHADFLSSLRETREQPAQQASSHGLLDPGQ